MKTRQRRTERANGKDMFNHWKTPTVWQYKVSCQYQDPSPMGTQPAVETDMDSIGESLRPHARQYTSTAHNAKGWGRESAGSAKEDISMRTIIKLVSSAGTGHFYITTRTPKHQSGKPAFQLERGDHLHSEQVPYTKNSWPVARNPRGSLGLTCISHPASSYSLPQSLH